MYMNKCQEYIKELLDEYGPLLERQLLRLVNKKFNACFENLDGYICQLCTYFDYERKEFGEHTLLSKKGDDYDADMIRAMEVMQSFIPQIVWHRKGRNPVYITFFLSTVQHDKEVYIVPVKQGLGKRIGDYLNDKFEYLKCEVIILLLESKKQMKLIKPNCNYKFALIKKDGVEFFERKNSNNRIKKSEGG